MFKTKTVSWGMLSIEKHPTLGGFPGGSIRVSLNMAISKVDRTYPINIVITSPPPDIRCGCMYISLEDQEYCPEVIL